MRGGNGTDRFSAAVATAARDRVTAAQAECAGGEQRGRSAHSPLDVFPGGKVEKSLAQSSPSSQRGRKRGRSRRRSAASQKTKEAIENGSGEPKCATPGRAEAGGVTARREPAHASGFRGDAGRIGRVGSDAVFAAGDSRSSSARAHARGRRFLPLAGEGGQGGARTGGAWLLSPARHAGGGDLERADDDPGVYARRRGVLRPGSGGRRRVTGAGKGGLRAVGRADAERVHRPGVAPERGGGCGGA